MRTLAIIVALAFVPTVFAQGHFEPAFSFGSGGVVGLPLGDDSVIHSVGFDTEGRVLVTGLSWQEGRSQLVIGRLDPNGAVDETFGEDGWFHAGSSESSGGYAIEPGPPIIAGGYEFRDGRTEILLVALDVNGRPLPTFGTDGRAHFDVGDRDDAAVSIVAHDEAFLVAGYAVRERDDGLSAEDFAVLRVDTTGTLDPEFGVSGRMVVSVGNDLDTPHDAIVVGPNLVVVGRSSHDFGMRESFSVARIDLLSGVLDAEFGDGGTLALEFEGYPFSRARAVVSPDGETLVLAGLRDVGEREEDHDLAAMRLDQRGALEPSFGTLGRWSASPTEARDERIEGLVTVDGRVVAVGQAAGQVFVATLSVEGSPEVELSSMDACAGSPIAVHDAAARDGMIMVVGTCSRGLFVGEAFVAAYLWVPDPAVDAGASIDAGSDASTDAGVTCDGRVQSDAGVVRDRDSGGCSCRADASADHWWAPGGLLLLLWRRR